MNHSRGRSLPAARSFSSLSIAGRKSSGPSKKTPVWSLMYFQPPAMCLFMITGVPRQSASATTRGEASLWFGTNQNLDFSMTSPSSLCGSMSVIVTEPLSISGLISAILFGFLSASFFFPTRSTFIPFLTASLTHLTVTVQLRLKSFHTPARFECPNVYCLARPFGWRSELSALTKSDWLIKARGIPGAMCSHGFRKQWANASTEAYIFLSSGFSWGVLSVMGLVAFPGNHS
mmetsp:Transcript_39420/g.93430  ORF Transcript_39420/g.93430 Transcript_39420/m.93430 type:complete len:232 (-) Transcript_39420:80-775(-)